VVLPPGSSFPFAFRSTQAGDGFSVQSASRAQTTACPGRNKNSGSGGLSSLAVAMIVLGVVLAMGLAAAIKVNCTRGGPSAAAARRQKKPAKPASYAAAATASAGSRVAAAPVEVVATSAVHAAATADEPAPAAIQLSTLQPSRLTHVAVAPMSAD
jgi:flagellar basal body-associated protein FliL